MEFAINIDQNHRGTNCKSRNYFGAGAVAKYREKRDFARTAEPSGATKLTTGDVFIVQKRAASLLHYDFRLELDGTLVNLAVTTGPSVNPDEKRAAVRTEDHLFDYARSEGKIPKSEDGGGTVMLWINGTWETLRGKFPGKTLPEGHVHFILNRRRIQAEWVLFRLKRRGMRRARTASCGDSRGDYATMGRTSAPFSLTLPQTCSPASGRERSTFTDGARGSRMLKRPTGRCSISIPTKASI